MMADMASDNPPTDPNAQPNSSPTGIVGTVVGAVNSAVDAVIAATIGIWVKNHGRAFKKLLFYIAIRIFLIIAAAFLTALILLMFSCNLGLYFCVW